MYIQYITYNFSTAIRLHVCSWHITKQKKIETIMECPSIKFPSLSYGSGFFPRTRYYYAFIVQKWKNTLFKNEISSKNFKFISGPRFNSCISISYTIKNSPKNFTHNLSFEVYMQFVQILW